MAARSAWSGAITFAGFPISVKAYNLAKSKSGDSFKGLCPCHDEPIEQVKRCVHTEDVVPYEGLHKGVEIAKGVFRALPSEALAAIEGSQRSEVLEPERFAPLDSIPFHISTGAYKLVPNEKVPGSQKPVAILMRTLASSERALVTEWVPRAGARDAIVVVWSEQDELYATTMPYLTDLNEVPSSGLGDVAVSAQETSMFTQVIEANYVTEAFDMGAYSSHYKERRDEAVQLALAGEEIPQPVAAPVASGPDLMAAMAQALESAKPTAKKAGAKKKAKATA